MKDQQKPKGAEERQFRTWVRAIRSWTESDSVTAERLFDVAIMAARKAALEEAAAEVGQFRNCRCKRIGVMPPLPSGQEHWGDCTERLYLAIRALASPSEDGQEGE